MSTAWTEYKEMWSHTVATLKNWKPKEPFQSAFDKINHNMGKYCAQLFIAGHLLMILAILQILLVLAKYI